MRPPDLPFTEYFQNMPCGSRAKYIGARCRCMLCRAANSRYQAGRDAAKKRGEHNGLVPADAVREHLLSLAAQGVGRRSVAAACDVGHSLLQEIKSGKRTQLRRMTERRILSVTVDAAADNSIISARRMNRQLAVLLNEGFNKAQLARRLGFKTPALQIGHCPRARARTVARVDRLFRIVMAGAEPSGLVGRPPKEISL